MTRGLRLKPDLNLTFGKIIFGVELLKKKKLDQTKNLGFAALVFNKDTLTTVPETFE